MQQLDQRIPYQQPIKQPIPIIISTTVSQSPIRRTLSAERQLYPLYQQLTATIPKTQRNQQTIIIQRNNSYRQKTVSQIESSDQNDYLQNQNTIHNLNQLLQIYRNKYIEKEQQQCNITQQSEVVQQQQNNQKENQLEIVEFQNQINKLQYIIKEKDHEIASLQNQCQELQTSMKQSQSSDNKKLSINEVTKLQDNLNKKTVEVQDLQKANKQFQQQIAKLEKDLEQENSKKGNEDQFEQQNQIRSLNLQINELQQQLESIQIEINLANERKKELLTEKNDILDQLEKNKSKIEDFNQQIQNHRRKSEQLEEHLSKKELEVLQKDQKIKLLLEQLEQSKRKTNCNNHLVEIRQLKNMLDEVNKQNEALQTRIGINNDSLLNQNTNLKNDIQQCNKDKVKMNDKIQKQKAKKKCLKDNIIALQSNLDQSQQLINKQTSEINRLNKLLSKDEIKGIVEKYENQIKQLLKELETVKDLQKQLHEMNNKNANLQNDIEALKMNSANYQSTIGEKDRQIKLYIKQQEELQKITKQMEQLKDSFTIKLQEKDKEIVMLMNQIKEKQEKIENEKKNNIKQDIPDYELKISMNLDEKVNQILKEKNEKISQLEKELENSKNNKIDNLQDIKYQYKDKNKEQLLTEINQLHSNIQHLSFDNSRLILALEQSIQHNDQIQGLLTQKQIKQLQQIIGNTEHRYSRVTQLDLKKNYQQINQLYKYPVHKINCDKQQYLSCIQNNTNKQHQNQDEKVNLDVDIKMTY